MFQLTFEWHYMVTKLDKYRYISFFVFQAIAGYDDGLCPRQPRDLVVHKYSKQVRCIVISTRDT